MFISLPSAALRFVLAVAGNVLLLSQSAVFAGADKTSRTPAYSEAEVRALQAQNPVPFKITTGSLSGLDFALVNGRPVNALDVGNLIQCDLEMVRYSAPLFRAMGFNALIVGYRDAPKETRTRVTPEYLSALIGILKENGLGIILRNHDEESALGLWRQLGIEPEILARYEKGRVYRTWGNILSDDFVDAQRAIFQADLEFLNRQGSLLSFQPNDEFSGPIVPVLSGREERGKYQAFAQRVFGDSSPDEDTNGDGTTYNSHFGTDYSVWQDVVPPEIGRGHHGHHYRDIPGKVAQFHRMFLADVWSRHISELGKVVGSVGGPITYNYGQEPNNWLSLLAATEHASAVDPIMYDPKFNFGYYAGAGWLFGKPSLASWINTFKGDYAQTRFLGVRSLPYTHRFVWWHMNVGTPADEAGAWGSDYNLADQWEFDGTPITWPEPVNRLVKIDPRMKAIGEVAPFLGRFSAKPRMEGRGILWVSPERDFPRDDYWVSEEVLSLFPDRIPWDRLKLVIYSGVGMDRNISETLKKFVTSGGTVLVDAPRLAKAADYLGRKNDQWQFGGQLVDVGIPSSDKLGYADSFNSFYQWHGDRKNATASMKWPAVEETGGQLWMMAGDQKNRTGSFEYEFVIPEDIAAVLIEDAPVAWNEGSMVRLDYQWGGGGWRMVYQFATPWTGGDNKLLVKLPNQPGKPRELRLRYTFSDVRRDVKDEYANDPRNVGIRGFRLSGLEAGQIEQAERVMDADNMHLELGEVRLDLRRQYDLLTATDGVSWTNPRGKIHHGEQTFPAFVDVEEGKGRWILALSGAIFSPTENQKARKAMLTAIADEVGVSLLGARDPYVLQSEDRGAVLAFRDGGEDRDAAFAKTEIQAKCALESPVVFQVFDKKAVPFRRAGEGTLVWTADLSGAMSDAVWVIKDAAKPVLLCADGTDKYGLRVDDGMYADGKLTFLCAENAYVASPVAPVRVTSPAGKVTHSYDAESGVLALSGPGVLAEVTVEYPKTPEG